MRASLAHAAVLATARAKVKMFDIKKNKLLFIWAPPFIWAGAILVLSFLPGEKLPQVPVAHLDKIIHFLVYFILSLLVIRLFQYEGRFSRPVEASFTLILAGGYGTLIELMQHFIPGRDSSIFDALINILGAVIGIIIGRIIYVRNNTF